MKTLIATLAAAAAVTAAVPAAAHPAGDYGYGRHERGHVGYAVSSRQHELSQMISIGVRRGSLTPREARILHDKVEDIAARERHYARGGLNRREVADLHRRIDEVEARITLAMQDRQYGHGYGRWR